MHGLDKDARKTSEAGMGLMEIIISVFCVLIVAVVVLQFARIGYGKIKLRWATESLAHELMDAKDLAKAREQNVSVLFDARHNSYGIDRNGNGKLDDSEVEELPDEMSLAEDATITFTKAGMLAPKSKEPTINISNARDSHKINVNTAGIIDID